VSFARASRLTTASAAALAPVALTPQATAFQLERLHAASPPARNQRASLSDEIRQGAGDRSMSCSMVMGD
jgi:hypothetical protein